MFLLLLIIPCIDTHASILVNPIEFNAVPQLIAITDFNHDQRRDIVTVKL